MQHFKVNETRHTAAGTFRAGMVYAYNPKKKPAHFEAIKAQIDAGIFEEISAKDAKGAFGGIQALGPQNPGTGKAAKPKTEAPAEPEGDNE